MIGRERETARLAALVADAAAGHGVAVVLHGEAGVGKSVLLRQASAAACGFRVLTATGVEAEAELTFSALADLLEPLSDHLDDLPEGQAAAVRSALRLTSDPVPDRFAVYAGTRALLATASEHEPLLIVVDDAHWVDAASREALLFCARRAGQMRTAIVLAVRDGAGAQLADSGLERLSVGGLTEDDGVQLAVRISPAIAPRVAHELHSGTGGNPLAIVELAMELTSEQLAGREPLPTPLPVGTGLARVFEERVRRLPAATQRALLVAAASETGRLDAIRAALERGAAERAALVPAEDAGLVAVADGHLEWRHPLVRSAAYRAASPAERRSAHAALAAVALDDSLDDHRAWHLAAAAEGPDEAVAVELERMAERAAGRGGMASVARALEAAARLTPTDGARARRFVAAAGAAIATGASARAAALLDEVARLTDDARLLTEAERLRARVDVMSGAPNLARDRLVAIAAPWEEDDPAFASELQSEAVIAHMAQGQRESYLADAERAFETARRAGPHAEPLPGVILAMGWVPTGRNAEGIELLDRYGDVVENAGLWLAAPEIVGMVALVWLWIERFAQVEDLLTRVTQHARRLGAIRALAFPLAVLAELHHRLGRWATAYAMASESVDLAEDVGEGALLANNVSYSARMEAALGRVGEARAAAQRALALCHAQNLGAIEPHAHYAQGFLDLSLGQPDEAIRHLEAINVRNTFFQEPGLSIWWPELAEAYIRAGRASDARPVLERFEHDVTATNRPRGRAVLGRLRGLLAPESRIDEPFAEALAWHERTPQPFERARTQLAYGERLRRARRRADAREQLTPALAIFEELGARIFADRARGELRAAGAREQTPDNGDPWSMLTAQERRVAEAVIDGATYGEAAAALYLSPRTVEHHLRQAYRKLGVRSRSEMAMRLTRR